jgi:hypothetical protein
MLEIYIGVNFGRQSQVVRNFLSGSYLKFQTEALV